MMVGDAVGTGQPVAPRPSLPVEPMEGRMKGLRESRMVLLKPEGQRRLEEAYEKRSRRRASWSDHAESYLRCLEDEGRLPRYLVDGLDPFDALASAADAQ